MNQQHQLHTAQIGIFNPGRMSDADIERVFVARMETFRLLIDSITGEEPGSIPQHHLVIGQRGMGKSTLLHRIAAELRKDSFNETFLPLTFPEEQYNVDRLSKFWLNCLDALADALDKKGDTQLTALEKQIDELAKKLPAEQDAPEQAFEQWCKKLGKRPVLLVDNLNLIFSRIDKKEQHTLRATLMSTNAPILVGASSLSMEEVSDYGAPFYDAFQMRYLKKLTLAESTEVLINFGQITGNDSVRKSLNEHRGRLAALYQLTGGTPRTLAMLFPLVQHGFSNDVQSDLDALTDMVTPLYKASFEELPTQMQVILDAIAIHWDPMTLEQLRQTTQLGNAQLSPQLKRLTEVGWLSKQDAYEARGAAYEISERFFNVWYLMRRSTRRHKRELLCLSKFLETLYGEEIEQIAIDMINRKAQHLDHVVYNLALAELIHDPLLKRALRSKGYEDLISMSVSNPSQLSQYDIPREILDENIETLLTPVKEAIDKEGFDEASLKLDSVEKSVGKLPYLIMLRGNIYFQQEDFEKATTLYQKAINQQPEAADWYIYLGQAQALNDQYEVAEKSFLKAVSLGAEAPSIHWYLGILYLAFLEKVDEAVPHLREFTEARPENEDGWTALAEAYSKNNEVEQALQSLKTALDLNPANLEAVLSFVRLIDEFKLAKEILDEAIKKATDKSHKALFIARLGGLLAFEDNDFETGIAEFNKAVELDPKNWWIWQGLGLAHDLLANHLKEAESAYKESIKQGAEIESCLLLAQLYMNKMNKQEEALDLLESWRGAKNDKYWALLGNIYMDFFNQPKAAEKAFKEQMKPHVKTDKTSALSLVALFRDKLSQIKKAKKLFKEVHNPELHEDSWELHKAMFAMYDQNLGHGLEYLVNALEIIDNELSDDTKDDWWRFGAVSAKLGYGEEVLKVLEEHGYDTILRPYYVAIKALTVQKPEAYMNSVAAEVREPARQIYAFMERYNQPGEDIEDKD